MSDQEAWAYDLEPAPEITVGDLSRVDIRVARVVAAEPFPEARRPSYRLRLDVGPLGERKSVAAIATWYDPQDLVGRLVLAAVNLPPRQIGPAMSEALTMGAVDAEGRVHLLGVDPSAPPGARAY